VEAAANGHRDAVELLLAGKASVETTDAEGTTPLIAASARGDLDLMRMLVDHRAKVDAQDITGATALMRAAANGRVEAIGLLLSKGADLKRLDRFRRTALFYAASNARPAAAKELLARGVDAKVRDVDGLDAYQSVIETMTAESLDRLDDRLSTLRALQSRHSPASRDLTGRTDLMIAAERGFAPIVRYVLSLKPDVNARDRYGKTALDWAETKMHDEAAATIRAAGGVSGG
jgi:ankyrin repeat protein